MDTLPVNPLVKFPPGTLEAIRKCWGLDKPGQMKEAVNILSEWAEKQPHFLETDFDKDFLENIITGCKGSIEKAKSRLDKYCTLKTLFPKYWEAFDYDKILKEYRDSIDMALIPRYAHNYNRIVALRYNNVIEPKRVITLFMYTVLAIESLKKYDYINGLILILDYRFVDLVPFMKNLDLMEIREMLTILIEGYGIRIEGIHYISESKLVEIFITLLKQLVKPSVAERIKVHKNEESLYDYIDKDILPAEYGGKEKSITELHDDLALFVGTKLEYLNKLKRFGTNESLRPKNQFTESYIGMPGTFRMLSVD